jgi:hypothetical protein
MNSINPTIIIVTDQRTNTSSASGPQHNGGKRTKVDTGGLKLWLACRVALSIMAFLKVRGTHTFAADDDRIPDDIVVL